jgi:hypothetical protein
MSFPAGGRQSSGRTCDEPERVTIMRNVVVSEFITMDGVWEDPGGSEKTQHGGWSFKFLSKR